MNDRVLVLTGSYHPDVGGGEALNQRHAELLAQAGFDVRVLVANGATGETATDGLGTPYTGVERWSAGGYSLIPPRRIEREIAQFAPAVLYLLGPNPHDAYARRIASRHGIAVALLYHADFRSDRAISRFATTAYAALAAKKLDGICVTTRAYERRLRDRGIEQDRIRYVGMGVDSAFFAPAERYGDREKNQLVFVGRLDANHTYKRLDLLLRALASLREKTGRQLELTVVGTGDRRSFFEEMAAQLGLSAVVRFAGQIDDAGLRAAYQAADVLVLPSPSESEGFGMVVLEAYACGCPVVTSSLAGSSEVVAASGCGALWRGEDPSDLAASIEAVLSDPAPRETVATKARTFAESEHSWDAVGRRLSGLMRDLAGAAGT